MKSMVRQFIAVTFGLCLSMLFSICSFSATGYPWFQVPNNYDVNLRFIYHDTSDNQKMVYFSRSTENTFYLAKPSDYNPNSSFIPRVYIYFPGSRNNSGYYGVTFKQSSFAIIDNAPGINISGANICWASQSYYSTSSIYSLQSTYLNNPNDIVRFGTVTIYHPNGTDGGTKLSASDFPLTCKINGYCGEFNYAGVTSDASYNATTINSNKANTAIELSAANASSIEDLSDEISTIGSKLQSSLEWISRNLTTLYNGYDVGTTWTDSTGRTHTYPTFPKRTYIIQDEHVVYSTENKAGSFLGILFNKINNILDFLQLQFEVWFQWFYPLKDANPQYWHVYNTDTDSTDVVNPATVTYYITWYLGQLFLMNNDNTPLGNLQDSVDDIKDQLVNVENQEQSIITSIRNGIDNFAPDLSQIGSFTALSWCSNYLQQIYVSLGAYGTVILIGLLLGVCMQFIGYFRYK